MNIKEHKFKIPSFGFNNRFFNLNNNCIRSIQFCKGFREKIFNNIKILVEKLKW